MDAYNHLGGSPRHHAYWEKSVSKSYIWYGYIYIPFLKWQNCRGGEQIVGGWVGESQGLGEGGYNYEGVPKQPLVFGGVLYSDHAGVSLSMEKQAPWKNTLCDI